MLSAVLRSDTAVKMSIQIIDVFVKMRHFMLSNAHVLQRLDGLEVWRLETDKKMEKVLTALESGEIQPRQGIFYDKYKATICGGCGMSESRERQRPGMGMDEKMKSNLTKTGLEI